MHGLPLKCISVFGVQNTNDTSEPATAKGCLSSYKLQIDRGGKNSSIPARITRLPCEDIGKVCDHILVLCEHIAEVCEHIVVLCEHIGTVCEHIVVLCEHIAEVCDHIAKATFEKLDERWMKGG